MDSDSIQLTLHNHESGYASEGDVMKRIEMIESVEPTQIVHIGDLQEF